MTRAVDVIIVGGGISGLWAARLLKKAGASFVVIDARERLGGRMRTMHPEAGHLEVGAQYVGRYQDYTRMACQAYDVDLIPTHHPRDVPSIWHDGDSRVLFTDSPYPVTAEVESGSAELEELVLNVRANRQEPWNALLAQKLDAVSVAQWMDDYLHEPYVKKLLHDGVRAALSAEPHEVSLLYFIHYCATAGSFARLMNIGDGAEDFRIALGVGELRAPDRRGRGAREHPLRERGGSHRAGLRGGPRAHDPGRGARPGGDRGDVSAAHRPHRLLAGAAAGAPRALSEHEDGPDHQGFRVLPDGVVARALQRIFAELHRPRGLDHG